jgi:hypothetical protein
VPSRIQFVFDPTFREAWENVPHAVFGQPLKPYSSWHRLCLEMIGSPVLTGEPIQLLELYAAVRICTSEYGYIPSFGAPKTWLARLLLRYRLSMYSLAVEAKRFGEYIADFDAGPKFWSGDGETAGGRPKCSEMDQVLETVSHVIRETGWDEATVWNLALGKLNWYSAAFVKHSGVDVPFWTPQDEEAYKRHVDRQKTEAKAKAKADGITFEEALKAVKEKDRDALRQAKLVANMTAGKRS